MAQLVLEVPDAAVPKILRGFRYDADTDGPPAAFVRGRLEEYLLVTFRRGDLGTHEDSFVREPDPVISK